MLKINLLVVILCIFCFNQSDCQDIYGVVSIQNFTDSSAPVFTVTRNDDEGFVTVFLLLVNATSDGLYFQPEVEINETVNVTCGIISTYRVGDAWVVFSEEVIPRGQLQADVFFNVTQQGRSVEVQCRGQSIMDPGDSTNLFDFETSQGPTGFVVVKKSPIVSFCDPIIQVPHEDGILVNTVSVKLSESVADFDVTVSCEIVGVINANTSLWLTFRDEVATPGMDSVTMQYNIRRLGSMVLVSCTAQSSQGHQFVTSTSAGQEAIFILDTGSVQLIPSISTVRVPTFSAYLVLSDRLQSNEGEITIVCDLVPVNSTEFARETIQNPSCVFPQSAEPPSPIATPCLSDANSTCPTTEASPISPAPNTSQISPWTLLKSEFVFEEGDLFKVVNAQLKSAYGFYKGILVLTCCAAYDVNSSPKYTNASAALIISSDVKPVLSLNSSAVPDSLIGLEETELLNPAFVEVSPCPCDLYVNKCDTDCCCDMDCDEEVASFTCIEGIQGGNFTPAPFYGCDSDSLYRSDWASFLCVHVSNSPHLGLFYTTLNGLQDISSFNSLKSQNTPPVFTSYEDSVSRDLDGDETIGTIGYQNGYPIELLYDGNLRGFLTLPKVALEGQCLYSSIIKFQEDFSSQCTKTMEISMCADYTPFSARMYLQPSVTAYPPCPVVPKVIRKYGQSAITETQVRYYCAEGSIQSYLKTSTNSTQNLTKTESFGEMDNIPEEPSMVRCKWDDGFTKPLVPNVNTVTESCDNVVLDVNYNHFWRSGELVSMEVTILLGSVPLPENTFYPQPDEEPFIMPPPFPDVTTIPEMTESVTVTDIVTDFQTDFDFLTVFEGLETIPQETLLPTTLTTSIASSTASTTQQQTTTPAVILNLTTPETIFNTTATSVHGTDVLMTATSLPFTNKTDTMPANTDVLEVTQKFHVTFTHMPETGPEIPAMQYKRSGNPGYNTGAMVFSGVAVYEVIETITESPANCTVDQFDPFCNETRRNDKIFAGVDLSNENRIQLVIPDASGLCSEASSSDIYFGENALSGCFIVLSLSDFLNCTDLRYKLQQKLKTFMPSELIGKVGDPDILEEGDWAAIFSPDDIPYEPASVSPTEPSVTTEHAASTQYPHRVFTPPQIVDQLSGVCFDVPTGIHLEILIADVGEYNGFILQEIVAANIRYSTSTLQLNCIGANVVRCQGSNTTGAEGEYVQSFIVTSSVTFTKIPAKEPQPVIFFYRDCDPTLCKRDSCWRGILYPFTASFEGDGILYVLAVTLIIILFTTGYLTVTKPWLGFSLR